MGGENFTLTVHTRRPAGSSPRGRGKRDGDARPWRAVRLIPAWAGKTAWSVPSSLCLWAHPRVGGENADSMAELLGLSGSSPRGRGKRRGGHQRFRSCRLIPAWAGKTSTPAVLRPAASAHPRVGGENQGDRIFDQSDNGSSPRGRGKHFDGDGRHPVGRLIPAWAGKTPTACDQS